MFYKFLCNIYSLGGNIMQTQPPQKQKKILCIKAAYTSQDLQPHSDTLRGINFTSREFLLIASW